MGITQYKVHTPKDDWNKSYSVEVKPGYYSCTCGEPELFHFFCVHVTFVLTKFSRVENYLTAIDFTWLTACLATASWTDAEYPCTSIDELSQSDLGSPLVTRRPGRPKKRRREREAALGVQEESRRVYKCGSCGQPGHNKGTCRT